MNKAFGRDASSRAGEPLADVAKEIEAPELFSSPRLPATRPWLPLLLGAVCTVVSLLGVQLLESDVSRWLFPAGVYGLMGALWALSTKPAQSIRRRLRLRLPWKRDTLVTRALLEHWRSAGILAAEAAGHEDVRRFEQHYGVALPDDLRDYFISINGTKYGWNGRDDDYAIGFWHLHQVRTFEEERISDDDDAARTFVLGKFWFGFATYGVRLSADSSEPTPVVARFPYGEFEVAPTVREFFGRYLLGDLSVLFPEFVVLADDHGIGAERDGVVSYAVMWSDVEEIAVEVTGAGDENDECVACWIISSQRGTIPFVAPVDTVAGGNVLRRRIRSLDGFDDAEFQAARAAEQRGEAGSFVVWRSATGWGR